MGRQVFITIQKRNQNFLFFHSTLMPKRRKSNFLAILVTKCMMVFGTESLQNCP